MIRRLLLAIDRSGHAEEAARVAGDLAAALAAEVAVLHVHEAPITAAVYRPEDLERAAVETAEAAGALVDRTVSRLRALGVTASGSVLMAEGATAAQIAATAREDGTDLLVVGARGMSAWRELVVGGVAHAIVQAAPCPVLVVPRRTPPAELRRMVLGVDGSAGAARAADLTSELAARLHAEVLVVHASDGSLADHEPDAIAAVAADAVGHDRVVAARVRAAGEGGVADALRAEAAAFGAGLLVVGRRGRSSLQRLLLGGVSERLLHTTSCPLLVVPPPPDG
jgi:nucleotide-binding universal stress UspA family protein